MKKNVMMRLASFLLVAVLISTSAISGTYAKYVTTAEGGESARVAEWGVQVGVAGFSTDLNDGLFLNSYKDPGNTTVTVEAEQKVVAPGTKNDEGVTFTLKGAPEVAVKVEAVFAINNEVVLPAATGYTDWTESVDGVYSKTFDVATDYYPVVFTLVDKANPTTPLAQGNLTAIQTYLNKTTDFIAPNTNLAEYFGTTGCSGEYQLTWEWAFGDTTGVTGNDRADTLLGNLAAGVQTAITGASYGMDFSFAITVTQVD